VMSGYSLAHAVMMMIPEAWESHTLMDEKRRAFYEYHAAMMEPWDGPAAVAFTDGRQIGATLDRNGLRPARYLVTDDDLVVMASESGVLPIPGRRVGSTICATSPTTTPSASGRPSGDGNSRPDPELAGPGGSAYLGPRCVWFCPS
ncbi:hypothetical protein, partial [Brevundimonas sp.]|uniref:hypothetical protein n=1 Tax=Brevundimonas sp. TaxID=1871086 RepID=UPI0025D5C3C2